MDTAESLRSPHGLSRPPRPERRLIIWQFVGVGTLMVGVGVLVWAAVAYYQSVSLG
jgi:hypothetical protein